MKPLLTFLISCHILLDAIELHGNDFTGTMPATICNLTMLEVLTIDCEEILCDMFCCPECAESSNATNSSFSMNLTDDFGSSDFA